MEDSRLRQAWHHFLAKPQDEQTERFWRQIRARHPAFVEAVLADARITAASRGERFTYRSALDAVTQIVRLVVVTDAFGAQICYRAKAALQTERIPLLPWVLHRAAVIWGQIAIGDPVVIEPGVYIPHGQVVVDGMTDIEARVVLAPFTTIGLVSGEVRGPTLCAGARIGSGARVLGPVTVGTNAVVGANAVVVDDVPAEAIATGVPARTSGG